MSKGRLEQMRQRRREEEGAGSTQAESQSHKERGASAQAGNSPESIDMLPGQVGSVVEEDEQVAPAAIMRRMPRRSVVDLEALRAEAIPFARTVRLCGMGRDTASVFVDSHNEVWALSDDGVEPLCTPPRLVTALAASPMGPLVGLADGTVNRLDEENELRVEYGTREKDSVAALATCTAGSHMLAATAGGQLLFGRRGSSGLRWTHTEADEAYDTVALSPCGTRAAAASGVGVVRLVQTERLDETIARIIVESGVVDMALSRDGRLLALLLDDGRLPIFRVEDHRRVFELRFDDPRPVSVHFSSDDALHGLVAHSGRIGSVRLTD